ncbi:HEAT repeat domain-containing protein [Candidatus Micrarchaeota archaeon]|nr:HEAT repeat domain-containing protein [Candidatus Micrarchaeota archaeon]
MQRELKKPENGPVQGKGFPKEPMENVPAERIREMLLGRKFEEAAAMGERAIPNLILALGDEDKGVRSEAVCAIVAIGAPAVPALASALKDGNGRVQEQAAFVLVKIAEGHPLRDWRAALPTLVESLRSGNTWVRGHAAQALEILVEKHPEYEWAGAVPVFIEALGCKDPSVRARSAGALKEIAKRHPEYDLEEAVPVLIEALNDENAWVKRCTYEALKNIVRGHSEHGSGKAIAALVECLRRTDEWVKFRASELLVEIGAPAAPALIGLLGDVDDDVRKIAATTLVKIGLGTLTLKDRVLCLLALSETDDVIAIGISAVPALVECMKHRDEDMWQKAVFVLGEMAKARPEEVAHAIVDYVNGNGGDALLEINEGNDGAARGISQVLLKCGEVMQNAA